MNNIEYTESRPQNLEQSLFSNVSIHLLSRSILHTGKDSIIFQMVQSFPKYKTTFQSLLPFPYHTHYSNIKSHVKRVATGKTFLIDVRQRLNVFPIAFCSTHQEEFLNNPVLDENDHLSLPGVKRSKNMITSPIKIVGEYEINQLMERESGWDRVKYMYRIRAGQFEDESTQVLNTMLYRTVVVGFCMNALVGSMAHSKAEKSLSKTDAISKGVWSQQTVSTTLMMNAFKDTLKLSILAFSLLHVSQTIAAYKNETSVWEFTLSSAVGFGAIGINRGLPKFGAFVIGGAVIGTIGGYAVCSMLQSAGLTQEIRNMKRMQQRVEEERIRRDRDE